MAKFLNSDELYGVIIDILAVTVLIDEREKDRELIEFAHAAMLHNHHLRPGKLLSRRMICEWFERRKPELKVSLANDIDNSFKTELLSNVKDSELQRRLLSSIFTIAICDYELHDEESGFIKTALKIWKTEMPSAKDLEAVA